MISIKILRNSIKHGALPFNSQIHYRNVAKAGLIV